MAIVAFVLVVSQSEIFAHIAIADSAAPPAARGGCGAGLLFSFLFSERSRDAKINDRMTRMEIRMAAWRPDITDYSVFDDAKADFIFGSASDYLAGIMAGSEAIDRKAFSLLSLLITIITAITAYVLSDCDLTGLSCSKVQKLPYMLALDGGYFVSALMLVFGCLVPRNFHLRGNSPSHLLRNDLCSVPASQMKISGAISLQHCIDQDLNVVRAMATWLSRSFYVTVCTPALIAMTLIIHNVSF